MSPNTHEASIYGHYMRGHRYGIWMSPHVPMSPTRTDWKVGATLQKKEQKLTIQSKVRTLSIKVYEEQMPDGWETVTSNIRAQNKAEIQIQAIKHYRDYNIDEWWEPSIEKPHYHIIARVLNNKSKRVKNILEDLGIVFRHPEDDLLWEKHGVETVKDYTSMSMYLTHETEQAILDGKEQYELEEIVSNLDIEEIKQIREGYVRISEQNRKVSNAEMVELDKIAEKKGYNLESYEDWVQTLDFATRNSAKMKTIKETYWYHANRRIEESKNMLRLCIFIQGEHDVGKTYNATKALQELGYRVFSVDSKDNSGKFDNLKTEHTAMVVDDATIENLLSMSDNRICQAYRRNKNNPFWCGEVLVVTSNKDFDTWAMSCGIDNGENLNAAESRFYICRIEENNCGTSLICDKPSKRGTRENQQARFKLYENFRNKMNEGLAEYKKMKNEETIEDIYKGININKQLPKRKLKINGEKKKHLKSLLEQGNKIKIKGAKATWTPLTQSYEEKMIAQAVLESKEIELPFM